MNWRTRRWIDDILGRIPENAARDPMSRRRARLVFVILPAPS
ncbi:MAG: hypothetical protein R3C40_07010 [Parvularculaceae bacterium]